MILIQKENFFCINISGNCIFWVKFLPKDAITVGGDSWVHLQSGKRFVATGVLSGDYLFSPELKGIVGKTYVRPSECKRLTRNEGVVII